MPDNICLHVAVQPAMAEAMKQAVESGEYTSQDEVVSEALLEWRMRRDLSPADREELCRLWDEGLVSGPGRFESMEEIKREARERLERQRDQT